jgi:hypothetical protein
LEGPKVAQSGGKGAKETDDGEGSGSVMMQNSAPRLLGHVIQALGALFSCTILAIGIAYAATIISNHVDPVPPTAPYTMVESGTGGGAVLWRLNTVTGELIACRSFGPAGVMPNDPSGAGCWRMGMIKQ